MTNAAEKVGSAIAILVGAFYLFNTFSISTYTPNPMDIGSRAYPLAVGILFTALSVIWAVSAWRPVAAPETASEAAADYQPHAESGFSWLRLLALAVLTFAAVWAIQPIGFVPTGIAFIFISIIIMVWDRPSVKQLLIYAVVAVIGSFALKWFLSDLLGIYLP